MSNASQSEAEIRCLKCSYVLRGLVHTVCPECGQSFDPTDPSTFDSRPPEWRRRRSIRRWVLLAAALIAGYFLYRNATVLDGKITFNCFRCGVEQTVYRWELQAPQWLGFRIPGLHWRTNVFKPPNESRATCANHSFGNLVLRFRFRSGTANATVNSAPNESPVVGGIDSAGNTVNERVTSPDNAVLVLEELMYRTNFGVAVYSQDNKSLPE